MLPRFGTYRLGRLPADEIADRGAHMIRMRSIDRAISPAGIEVEVESYGVELCRRSRLDKTARGELTPIGRPDRYPAVKTETDEISETIDEGFEEHHVAKTLIDELPTVEAGSDEWVAKVKVLIESVEHHADEEEKNLFPPVRSHTETATLESLGEQLAARKVELGAPPMDMALELTTEALKELASKQEIPGRSSMDREELAATVDPRG